MAPWPKALTFTEAVGPHRHLTLKCFHVRVGGWVTAPQIAHAIVATTQTLSQNGDGHAILHAPPSTGWWARVPAALRASKTRCFTHPALHCPFDPKADYEGQWVAVAERRVEWYAQLLLRCCRTSFQRRCLARACAHPHRANLQMSTLAPSPRSHKGASARQHAHPDAEMVRLRQRPPTPMGKVAPWPLGRRPSLSPKRWAPTAI